MCCRSRIVSARVKHCGCSWSRSALERAATSGRASGEVAEAFACFYGVVGSLPQDSDTSYAGSCDHRRRHIRVLGGDDRLLRRRRILARPEKLACPPRYMHSRRTRRRKCIRLREDHTNINEIKGDLPRRLVESYGAGRWRTERRRNRPIEHRSRSSCRVALVRSARDRRKTSRSRDI